MLSDQQINLLKAYQDKAFVSSILSEKSSNYYGFLKNLFSIPLILSNSIICIINSSTIDSNQLKIINVILNGFTTLILTLTNFYKFSERCTLFKQNAVKFNKIVHGIEDSLINDIQNLTLEQLRTYIDQYDLLTEQIEFSFPEHIKKEVKETYKNDRVLPNSINCIRSHRTPALKASKSNLENIIIPLNQDES